MEECVIVIPVYQPTMKLRELIEDLRFEWITKIVCVNDGSDAEYDGVFDQIGIMDKVCVLRHAVNMGKGRALKTAFNYILSEFPNQKMVITVDADGQHTTAAVEKVHDAFREEDNIILGKREFTNIESKREIPFRSRFGNRLTRLVFNFLCNINISDTQTGLRVLPMAVLPGLIRVPGEKYEYETNCLLWCKDHSIGIKEVEIETIYEKNNESSHFNPLQDSIRIYIVIFKYMCSSILSVLIDYTVFFVLAGYSGNVFLLTYLGRICASAVNFLVNRKLVFGAKGKIAMQAVKYFLLVFLSGTLSAVAVLKIQLIIKNLYISKVLVEMIIFFFNFYIQKNIVFVKKETKIQ
ncbi:MAG: bifunctional glycosyltransferase family 2/GtrA family protein [Blautia sp.]|nr:bifunctional glycosyltransferase family 2/GtrA family protein [Blautia sp.]MCM1200871.1 bifunctional glycosyltransferase family 2/GtrA family protein [Bacteroides fragilis]